MEPVCVLSFGSHAGFFLFAASFRFCRFAGFTPPVEHLQRSGVLFPYLSNAQSDDFSILAFLVGFRPGLHSGQNPTANKCADHSGTLFGVGSKGPGFFEAFREGVVMR
jgi:hypothetical protein